jgi:hypothetical protein
VGWQQLQRTDYVSVGGVMVLVVAYANTFIGGNSAVAVISPSVNIFTLILTLTLTLTINSAVAAISLSVHTFYSE